MIIGIYGRKRSGKDFTFDVISEVAVEMGLVPERRKFADKLYDAVAALLGLTRQQVEHLKELAEGPDPYHAVCVDTPDSHVWFTMRDMLERMGTEVGRNIFGENFWVDQTLPGDYTDYSESGVYGVTDMRFPNEYHRVRRLGGTLNGKRIKIIGTPEIQAEDISGHPSRGALIENLEYDWVIDNSDRDIDRLRPQVVQMMERFRHA